MVVLPSALSLSCIVVCADSCGDGAGGRQAEGQGQRGRPQGAERRGRQRRPAQPAGRAATPLTPVSFLQAHSMYCYILHACWVQQLGSNS